MYLRMCVLVDMNAVASKWVLEDNPWESGISLNTWVLGTELRTSGLVVMSLPTEPSCWPKN